MANEMLDATIDTEVDVSKIEVADAENAGEAVAEPESNNDESNGDNSDDRDSILNEQAGAEEYLPEDHPEEYRAFLADTKQSTEGWSQEELADYLGVDLEDFEEERSSNEDAYTDEELEKSQEQARRSFVQIVREIIDSFRAKSAVKKAMSGETASALLDNELLDAKIDALANAVFFNGKSSKSQYIESFERTKENAAESLKDVARLALSLAVRPGEEYSNTLVNKIVQETAKKLGDIPYADQALKWFERIGAAQRAKNAVKKLSKCNSIEEVKSLGLAGSQGKIYWGDTFSGDDGFQYYINGNDEAVVTGYSGSEKNITVPSEIRYNGQNIPVTRIGDNAFSSVFRNIEIETISAPSVRTIGDYAFERCKSLVQVDFPNVEEVGHDAFAECNSLTEIDFSKATFINHDAFLKCPSLATANLPNVEEVGYEAFSGCTSLATVSSHNVITIGEEAFAGCTALVEIDLSKAEIIDSYAFSRCENLKKINLESAVIVWHDAFRKAGIEKIEKLSSIENLNRGSFSGCSSLELANFPKEALVKLAEKALSKHNPEAAEFLAVQKLANLFDENEPVVDYVGSERMYKRLGAVAECTRQTFENINRTTAKTVSEQDTIQAATVAEVSALSSLGSAGKEETKANWREAASLDKPKGGGHKR